jgi:hypothetical protein
MRIILSFESFAGFGGTESYTLTVALELERLGHDVSVYAPERGIMAEFARSQGVRVLGHLELPGSCDLLICSDAVTCHELAGRYPGAARIFVAHSVDYALQAPPPLHDRCHAIVVLNDRVRRAVQARGWHAPLVRLRQPIDLARFWDAGPPRRRPRNVLVLTNYVEGVRARMIDQACRAHGLNVTWVGATSRPTPTPEQDIAAAEIVIGLGRSVLEAMAGGRAAYVYGVIGGDGWVTPERYPAMEADGFAGSSSPELIIDGGGLLRDLTLWEESMGEVNRDLASTHHSAREHAIDLIGLARELHAPPPLEPAVGDELARLVRLQWQAESRAAGSTAEAGRLRLRLAELEEEAAMLRTRIAQADRIGLEAAASGADEQLQALRNSLRYRLACRIAWPFDRVRHHLERAGE